MDQLTPQTSFPFDAPDEKTGVRQSAEAEATILDTSSGSTATASAEAPSSAEVEVPTPTNTSATSDAETVSDLGALSGAKSAAELAADALEAAERQKAIEAAQKESALEAAARDLGLDEKAAAFIAKNQDVLNPEGSVFDVYSDAESISSIARAHDAATVAERLLAQSAEHHDKLPSQLPPDLQEKLHQENRTATVAEAKPLVSEKPSQLQEALSNLRSSPAKRDLFILQGDERVVTRVKEELLARGKMHMSGGRTVITASHAELQRIVRDASREFGVGTDHVARLDMPRSGSGLQRLMQAATFRSRDSVDIMVAGTEAVRAQYREKFAETLMSMSNNAYANVQEAVQRPNNGSIVNNGEKPTLTLPANGPITVSMSDSLASIITHSRVKVDGLTDTPKEASAAPSRSKQGKSLDNSEAAPAAATTAAKASATESAAVSAPTTEAKNPSVNLDNALQPQSPESRVEHMHEVYKNLKEGGPVSEKTLMDFGVMFSSSAGMDATTTTRGESANKELLEGLSLLRPERIASDVQDFQRFDFLRNALTLVENTVTDKLSIKTEDLVRPNEDGVSPLDRLAAMFTAEVKRDPLFNFEKDPMLADSLGVSSNLSHMILEAFVEGRNMKDFVEGSDLKSEMTRLKDVEALLHSGLSSEEMKEKWEALQSQSYFNKRRAAAEASTEDAGTTATPVQNNLDFDSKAEKSSEAAAPTAEPQPTAPEQSSANSSTSVSESGSAAPEKTSGAEPVAVTESAPTQERGGAGESLTPASSEAAPKDTSVTGLQQEKAPSKEEVQSAESILSALVSVKAESFAALEPNKEGQAGALAGLDATLKDALSGRLGDSAKALAEELGPSAERWRAEVQSTASAAAVPASSAEATRSPSDKESSAPVAAQNESLRPEQQAERAQQDKAKEQASKQVEAEVAASKLVSFIQNPAVVAVGRDNTWNSQGVANLMESVSRMDTGAFTRFGPQQRARVATAATWLASQANRGRIPGFRRGEPHAGALSKFYDKLMDLQHHASEARADRRFGHMVERADKFVDSFSKLRNPEASKGSDTTTATAASPARDTVVDGAPRAEKGFSPRELDTAKAVASAVNAVFNEKGLTEKDVRTLLENKDLLKLSSLKSLDPATQAKAGLAIKEVGMAVKSGLLDNLSKSDLKGAMDLISSGANLESAIRKDGDLKGLMPKADELYGKLGLEERGITKSAGSEAGASQEASTKARDTGGMDR